MTFIATLVILLLHFTIWPTLPIWVAVVPFILMVAFYVAGFLFIIRFFR